MKDFLADRARENAQRGMEYLDTHHPGWENSIPLDSLDVRCGDTCVVAHLTGHPYSEGVATLNISDTVSLGFFVRGPMHDPHVMVEYGHLTMEFKSGIQNRLDMTKMQVSEQIALEKEAEVET